MFLENIPGLETLINKIQDMIAGERFFFSCCMFGLIFLVLVFSVLEVPATLICCPFIARDTLF